MFACLHGNGDLRAVAFAFSPTVEQTAPDTVTFDVAGLERLFGLPQEVAAAIAGRAPKCHLALAANPDAAICAARGFSGVSIIPQGDEAKFLAPLPISLLAPSPELMETLERWGIRRMRELAALPPLGIAERLGPEGLRLRELARGEASRKLIPLEDPLCFEEQLEVEHPLELLEPLAFLLARLLAGLVTRLASRALAADELILRLRLENRTVHERTLRLPVPSLDSAAFLKLWRLDLEAHPPASPVVHVWMAAHPAKPRAAQSGLFIPAAPEPVKLELTLARIQAIVGQDRVGVAELVDTHRPGAFGMRGPKIREIREIREIRGQTPDGVVTAERRSHVRCLSPNFPNFRPPNFPAGDGWLVLRAFRPPRAARVALTSGQPSFIAARGIGGKVVELAGPWRTSGDWWTTDPWSRDEWDIALSDGVLYRLYCDPCGWFVEGSYD